MALKLPLISASAKHPAPMCFSHQSFVVRILIKMTKDWLLYKQTIRDLYVVQGKTLEDVRKYLKENEDFDASWKGEITCPTGLDHSARRSKNGTSREQPTAASSNGVQQQSRTFRHPARCLPQVPTGMDSTNLPNIRGDQPSLSSVNFPQSPAEAQPPPTELVLAVLDQVFRGASSLFLKCSISTHKTLLSQPIILDGGTWDMPGFQGVSGEHLLCIAAKSSSAEVVKLLLDHGADFRKPSCLEQQCDAEGLKDLRKAPSPLMIAIEHNDVAVVKEFLLAGAATGRRGYPALLYAAEQAKDPSTVSELLKFVSGVDCLAVGAASAPKHLWDILDSALRRRSHNYGDKQHAAATEVVVRLLDAGVSPVVFLNVNHVALFIEPWLKNKGVRDWGKHFNRHEQRSLLHFARLPQLHFGSRYHRPASSQKERNATLGHELLFHLPDPGVMDFLVSQVDVSAESGGVNLLLEITKGCEKEFGNYQNRTVARAIKTLLQRGIDAERQEQSGRTALQLLLERAVRCATGGFQSQQLVLAELKALLGPGGANPTRRDGASYPILKVLHSNYLVNNHPQYACQLVETLLSHFPDPGNMHQAPAWQRSLSEYLPITESYQNYSQGSYFHDQLNCNAGLDGTATDIFLRAARIVSMRKYLRSQIRMESPERSYPKIRQVVSELKKMGALQKNFPSVFVLDVLDETEKSVLAPQPQPPHQEFAENPFPQMPYMPMESFGQMPGQTLSNAMLGGYMDTQPLDSQNLLGTAPSGIWGQQVMQSSYADMQADGLTPTEFRLKALWQQVIPDAPHFMTSDTDFFQVGGTLPMLDRLQALIQKTFSTNLCLVDVFNAGSTSLGSMAHAINPFRAQTIRDSFGNIVGANWMAKFNDYHKHF